MGQDRPSGDRDDADRAAADVRRDTWPADVTPPRDAASPDVALEAGADGAPIDAAPSDSTAGDFASMDLAAPDHAAPELTAADVRADHGSADAPADSGGAIDQGAPDATPDRAGPDAAPVDAGTPDQDSWDASGCADFLAGPQQLTLDTLSPPQITGAWRYLAGCPPQAAVVRRAQDRAPASAEEGEPLEARLDGFDDTAPPSTLICYTVFLQHPRLGTSAGRAACAIAGTTAVQAPAVDDDSLLIDGRDNDLAWQRSPALTYRFDQQWSESEGRDPELSGYVRIAYDPTAFYFFIQADDRFIHADSPGEVWHDDGVEIFFDVGAEREDDGQPDPDDYHLIITPDPELWWSGRGDGAGGWDTSWNPDIARAVRLDGSLNDEDDVDTGWSLELAVPLDAMGLSEVQPGQVIGFTFWINEDDTVLHDQQHWYRWTPGTLSMNTSTWGLCTF